MCFWHWVACSLSPPDFLVYLHSILLTFPGVRLSFMRHEIRHEMKTFRQMESKNSLSLFLGLTSGSVSIIDLLSRVFDKSLTLFERQWKVMKYLRLICRIMYVSLFFVFPSMCLRELKFEKYYLPKTCFCFSSFPFLRKNIESEWETIFQRETKVSMKFLCSTNRNYWT